MTGPLSSRPARRHAGRVALWGVALLLCGAVARAGEAAPEAAFFTIEDGDTLWWHEVFEVVGSRVPVGMSGIMRSVGVVDRADVAALPGRSAAEVLGGVAGVSVSQRQHYGTQADLSVRGSTFEQVQVLLDGIPVGDPQTGHHTLNLPLGLADVERLEVLRGQASSLYGANAVGGTVNVVTARPGERNRLSLGMMGGGDATWRAGVNGDLVSGAVRTRLGVEHFRTDGHRANTDVDTWNATLHSLAATPAGDVDVFAGHGRRAFGAQDFYVPAWPSFETTTTTFVSARLRRDLGERITIEPRLFARRHEDEFVLERHRPDIYTNTHVSRRIGAELRVLVDVGAHSVAAGLEASYEDLDSDGIRGGAATEALGEHLRRHCAASLEIARRESPLRWQAGLRADLRDGYRMRASESVAVSYDLRPELTLRSSVGSSFRIPTWTELHYVDPVSVGDPGLDPERGWSWDTGLFGWRGPWTASIGYFERREEDRIDWIDTDGSGLFRVMNIGDYDTRGVEAQLGWDAPAGHSIGLSYTRFDRDYELPEGFAPRYAVLVPRDIAAASATLALPGGGSLCATARYFERNVVVDTDGLDFASVLVVDWRLVTPDFGPGRVTIDVTNMLDRPYTEIVQPVAVPMPGTLVTAGWTMDFQ